MTRKPHWLDGLKGLSASAGLLAAGLVTGFPPETRALFIRALLQSYCTGCGYERKDCRCRRCAYGRCEGLLEKDEPGPYCHACNRASLDDEA